MNNNHAIRAVLFLCPLIPLIWGIATKRPGIVRMTCGLFLLCYGLISLTIGACGVGSLGFGSTSIPSLAAYALVVFIFLALIITGIGLLCKNLIARKIAPFLMAALILFFLGQELSRCWHKYHRLCFHLEWIFYAGLLGITAPLRSKMMIDHFESKITT